MFPQFFFLPVPPLGIGMLANYKWNLTNQSYRRSHWGNHKLHCAVKSIYYPITRFPISPSVSCRHKSIFALLGNHGNDQFYSTLAALCITIYRTRNELLISLGRFLFEFVCAHFYKGITCVYVCAGIHLYNPMWKLNIHVFCLLLSHQNKNLRHNLEPVLWYIMN